MAGPGRKQEFAVIGLGRFGSSLARQLEVNGHVVLAIDSDPRPVQAIADQVTQAVTLDATSEEALRAVDITSFDTVIVTIGTDFEASLLAIATLKHLGVRRVIAKGVSGRQSDILQRIGADRVVQPERDGGMRLADELSAPRVSGSLSLEYGHSVAQVAAPKAWIGRSLSECNMQSRYGLSILLIHRGADLLINPAPDTELVRGDWLVVVGRDEDIIRLSQRP
ncbi:MAG: TrkA family potassium uptake protein [Candidatus Promineifilaceae bacterium]|nr:TrkA family potassium uptake protein [Candidatus Promineifilaceae bacterium]